MSVCLLQACNVCHNIRHRRKTNPFIRVTVYEKRQHTRDPLIQWYQPPVLLNKMTAEMTAVANPIIQISTLYLEFCVSWDSRKLSIRAS